MANIIELGFIPNKELAEKINNHNKDRILRSERNVDKAIKETTAKIVTVFLLDKNLLKLNPLFPIFYSS